VDQLGRRTTYSYDAASQRLERLDARGQRTTYTHDELGRQTGILYQEGPPVTYTYDPVGRRTAMADASGTTNYSYDDADRLTQVAYPGNKTITTTYDAAGGRTEMVDPDGGRTTYSYDEGRRLTSLLNPVSERTTWQYDALGRVTLLTQANQTRATHTYDAGGNLTRVAHVQSDDTVLSSFDYGYDAAGNRTGVVEANGDRVTWSYDATYQLTRERRDGDNSYDITYTYDPVGNRLTKVDSGATTSYTYDAANQLSTEDDGTTVTTYAYDDSGNNTLQNAGGAVTTYAWDGENRLAAIALADGAVQTMTYDATGLRRKKQTAAGVTRFVWDGRDVLLETNGNWTTQARYTLTPDDLGLLVAQRRNGTSAFYHGDALGSAVGLTDTDETLTDSYRYFAFGDTLTSSGSTVNPFRFVGQLGYYHEPTLGLQYLRARWYRPRSASFVSSDPVGTVLSRYAYVRNAPLVGVDPTGARFPQCFPLTDWPCGDWWGDYQALVAADKPTRDLDVFRRRGPKFYLECADILEGGFGAKTAAKAWRAWVGPRSTYPIPTLSKEFITNSKAGSAAVDWIRGDVGSWVRTSGTATKMPERVKHNTPACTDIDQWATLGYYDIVYSAEKCGVGKHGCPPGRMAVRVRYRLADTFRWKAGPHEGLACVTGSGMPLVARIPDEWGNTLEILRVVAGEYEWDLKWEEWRCY
jgi:RHS repeat-associated protein